MHLHVSSTVVLIIRRSKFYYTASDIVTRVGDRLVRSLRGDSVHRKATYRCDDIRCCIIKFDLLMMSTTVLETCRGI